MRIGSLFSGYGGLDLAVETVLDAHTVWHVENNPAAARVLAHHWPDTPNHGDITTVDWGSVEPVDILAGGFPCQDVSAAAAGKRLGLRPGTRSGLWTHMAYAVAQLRPRLVIIENVRGLLSAEAHSDLEPCPRCLGNPPRPALRALGAVLGDLAQLGYDARWCGLRAADVGAPHGRFRVFVVAADTRRLRRNEGWIPAPRRAAGGRPLGEPRRHCPGEPAADTDQPRPQGPQPTQRRLLPARRATADTDHPGRLEHGRSGAAPTEHAATQHRRDAAVTDWGTYTAAIRRWEDITGRPAPAPVQPGRDGGHRLSPRFVEWMMGLPDGWVTAVPADPDVMLPGLPAAVTDIPALTRVDMLTALGNGVVPQQAAAALRLLLTANENGESPPITRQGLAV